MVSYMDSLATMVLNMILFSYHHCSSFLFVVACDDYML
jgi:hypothetical protein